MSEDTEFEFISDEAVADLNPRQKTEYALYRSGFLDWMREVGKDPEKGKGLSESCVENYAHRHHQIMRLIWDELGRFTARPQQKHADAIVIALDNDEIRKQNDEPYSNSSKRKFNNVLSKWFEYRHHEYGSDEWEPPVEFEDESPENESDYFTKEERSRIWDASLQYRTPPAYDNLSPEERDRWKAQIAQILGKPKDDVRPSDFEQLRTDWKYPSLIGATLDGALRPIEINRIQEDWLRLEVGKIEIPRDQAAKSRENWDITLRQRTVQALQRWMAQRENKIKYDDRDEVWLTKKGNPYTSKTLNYLLDNLLEEAGISQENRRLTWYSFRKSTAQYVQAEADDLTTASFLRSRPENVQNYAEPTHERKRDILERIDDE